MDIAKDSVQAAIDSYRENIGSAGELSDGYHTFNELYHHRAVLFAMICNQNKNLAWKSLKHFEESDKMYDGMFIVGIDTPYGQVTYHYDVEPYWDMFNVPELEKGKQWDGSTANDCIARMTKWLREI